MSRTRQFATALFCAFIIAACGSHFLSAWLKLKTNAGQAFIVGRTEEKSCAFLAGSSLANYGISWQDIAAKFDLQIKVWGIAGGSPFEWEQFQPKAPEVQTSFIVVSAYDLDEAIICDFRAQVVPLEHTVKALIDTHADWAYSKSALSQYAITWLRTLFPTLGRSRGVMGDLRIKLGKLLKPSAVASESEAGPTLNFEKHSSVDEYTLRKVSDWSKSTVLGKIVAMQSGLQGGTRFEGPKKLAFEHMLRYADQRGRTIVIVLPVSPTYAKEFLPPKTADNFENSLAEVRRSAPRAQWVRLDEMSVLNSDENFCDLVHMNLFGQKLTTEALLAWLDQNMAHL